MFIGGAALWTRSQPPADRFRFCKWRHRIRRPFPFAFSIVAGLAFLGGFLYAPNNFDGLAYRTPRVLHWLAEGRWHWIHTHFGNVNTRGAGFEWVTAPLFAFTKTDRLEFLINAICFLFLPGRVFAVLTRLRVSPRVAFYWMWIYPTAYGFLLQAGSIGNDLFSALWPIAAIEFALRARQRECVNFLWYSGFAAALMTASKAFNLLLLPSWGLALLPTIPLLAKRPATSVFAALIAGLASMIPTAILNVHYCGDWTGLAAEPVRLNAGPPVFQAVVNTALVVITNFAPPVFPFASAWDRFVQHALPTEAIARLNKYFEGDAARFRIGELPVEESAGIGFGISVLLLIILLFQLFARPRSKPGRKSMLRNVIALAAVGGAYIFMAGSGLYAPARYLLPLCFPIIVPLLALPASELLVRRKSWRRIAVGTFCLSGITVILSPARPLWPALTLLSHSSPSAPLAQRAQQVYSTYRERADILHRIRQAIPLNERTIGLIIFNDPETSLWRPFGSRKICHIRREDSPEFTRRRGIKYVVLDPGAMETQFKMTGEQWAVQNHGVVVGHFPIRILARGEPSDWLLVLLNP